MNLSELYTTNVVSIHNTATDAHADKFAEKVSADLSTYTAETSLADSMLLFLRNSSVNNKITLGTLKTFFANAVGTVKFEVVATLPETGESNIIYLVPKSGTPPAGDVKDEYIYLNGAWELIGSTSVDLSAYYTSAQTDTLLNSKSDTGHTHSNYLTDAASDGNEYVRKNGAWAVSTHNTANDAHADLFAAKVDKVAGKGLSTEDYTTAEKTKLSGIAEGAEVNVNADWNATSGDAQILNKPTIPDAQIQADWNQATDTAKDYIKNKPTIPTNSDFTLAGLGEKSYNNLTDKPTIPDAQIQSDWNQTTDTAKDFIKNKPTIPTNSDFTLAGLSEKSYNNLTDKPTIPAAQVQSDWNATSGMGQILNKPSIPTKTSDLTNDSDFTTSSAVSSGYVAKDGSKVLSDNNYDSTSKSKLDGLANITSVSTGLTLTSGTLTADAGSGADTNLSNVTATGKAASVGWGMPDVANGASKSANTLYQATTNGWVTCITGSDGGGVYVYSDSEATVLVYGNGTGVASVNYMTIPVSKGLYYKASTGSSSVKFYPCVGG